MSFSIYNIQIRDFVSSGSCKWSNMSEQWVELRNQCHVFPTRALSTRCVVTPHEAKRSVGRH